MPLPTVATSLSAKLLVLTILFVLLAEVLIYTPSIARFRMGYLEERLAAAHIAALSVEAAPDFMVTRELQAKLLAYTGTHVIDVIQPGARVYMLSRPMPPEAAAVYDLRGTGLWMQIVDAAAALGRGLGDRENRVIRVIDRSPNDPAQRVEVTMDERPVIEAMLDFSRRILAVSVGISLFAAVLVYLTLHALLVRPMRRLTADVVAFRRDPDGAPPVVPGRRRDEIGVAERELASMQGTVRAALRQRERLATLGTAVAKINHDLRGILSTASLLSERLTESGDPEVRRVTPRLLASLDRAVELCGQTLSFTRDGVLPLAPAPADLHRLAEEAGAEVLATVRPDGGPVEATWINDIPAGTLAVVDAAQFGRLLVNLGRNAVQAGADRVRVAAESGPGGQPDGRLLLTIADNGPGLAPRARENLFQPFAGSARAGGIGLGLAIAREVARAHGGDLRLVESGAGGTVFALDLPQGKPGAGGVAVARHRSIVSH
ncbi:sensor histidine kinase [Azospirillum picis]|uniref:Signal transduction histidine-protein kinase/phosphatase MprB n=1 Tax=Azospirillum picis TaxID=488438 RepID=A0ABU0MPD2_9PROT|nr:HAMP domain-containing sensor histidine kinase [Azospirillum picis]MBP2301493.1 signal transduction histidine kinase [Azospirillum picis]MDQ0535325.1 signal transduction histidine kinase [Azospirillum picis]